MPNSRILQLIIEYALTIYLVLTIHFIPNKKAFYISRDKVLGNVHGMCIFVPLSHKIGLGRILPTTALQFSANRSGYIFTSDNGAELNDTHFIKLVGFLQTSLLVFTKS